jgi:hypothetical protein
MKLRELRIATLFAVRTARALCFSLAAIVPVPRLRLQVESFVSSGS